MDNNCESSGIWDPDAARKHINFKELLTMLIALKCYGLQLSGKSVQILSFIR